jgi:hypothetical protein
MSINAQDPSVTILLGVPRRLRAFIIQVASSGTEAYHPATQVLRLPNNTCRSGLIHNQIGHIIFPNGSFSLGLGFDLPRHLLSYRHAGVAVLSMGAKCSQIYLLYSYSNKRAIISYPSEITFCQKFDTAQTE